MVVYSALSDAEIDAIFQALADATRRDIVARVMEREQSVSSLAESYAMSFAAVQKHVAVLERAALVSKARRGREQIVHGNAHTIEHARGVLESYEALWRHRIARIDDLLSNEGDRHAHS
jgi:DNA-binding transcriptional ArsR family regulator